MWLSVPVPGDKTLQPRLLWLCVWRDTPTPVLCLCVPSVWDSGWGPPRPLCCACCGWGPLRRSVRCLLPGWGPPRPLCCACVCQLCGWGPLRRLCCACCVDEELHDPCAVPAVWVKSSTTPVLGLLSGGDLYDPCVVPVCACCVGEDLHKLCAVPLSACCLVRTSTTPVLCLCVPAVWVRDSKTPCCGYLVAWVLWRCATCNWTCRDGSGLEAHMVYLHFPTLEELMYKTWTKSES